MNVLKFLKIKFLNFIIPKIKFLKLIFVVFAGSFLLFSSCEKSLNDNNQEFPDYESFISLEQVKEIAKKIDFNEFKNGTGLKAAGSSSIKKDISNIRTIYVDDGAAFYVINFKKEAGFVIISADDRALPILAFSDKGNIDIDNLPAGLQLWIEGKKEYIKSVRKNLTKSDSYLKSLWASLEVSGIRDEPLPDPDDPPPLPTTVTVGPLLSTAWTQRCGYNALCPYIPGAQYCDHALTGCAATAMAQIMKYHNYPAGYNWSAMPNNSGNIDVAALMRDIGDALDMDYGANYSSTTNDGRDAFVNDFNYSSTARSIDYFGNQGLVEDNIQLNRPVLFNGGEKEYFLGIPYFVNGHAWVCDGYMRMTTEIGSYLYFSMNWGWYDNTVNGWYAYNNFSVLNSTYDYKLGCVLDIKP